MSLVYGWKLLTAVAAIAVAAPSHQPVKAQEPTNDTRLEASIGVARGAGGRSVRDQRLGYTMGFSIFQRWRETSRAGHLLGLSGRHFSVVDNRDDCQGAPGGPCFTRYPTFQSIGVLTGVEVGGTSDRLRAIRVLGGLTYVRVDGAEGVGIEAGLGAPFARIGALSFGLVLDGSVVPQLRGATWWWGSAGISAALGW